MTCVPAHVLAAQRRECSWDIWQGLQERWRDVLPSTSASLPLPEANAESAVCLDQAELSS